MDLPPSKQIHHNGTGTTCIHNMVFASDHVQIPTHYRWFVFICAGYLLETLL